MFRSSFRYANVKRFFSLSRTTTRNMIDFRSDTVTQPTEAMRKAMVEAPVGDDVYNEDPMVNQLEQRLSTLCGKEAGLFVCSGTMSNQLGLRSLLQPMQAVICDAHAHVYVYESTATAHLSQALLIPVEPDPLLNYLTVDRVRPHLKPVDVHYARRTVISLEIPMDGIGMPLEELRKFRKFADEHQLKIHLDGARLWNVTVAERRSLRDYCDYADTVSLCFSKSLGAPIGSILVGTRDLIDNARKFRKLLGGGWRQAGILAAAALFAVDHHVERLEEDHVLAKHLAHQLISVGCTLCKPVETNMVFVDFSPVNLEIPRLAKELERHGIIIFNESGYKTRLAIHLQTPKEAIDRLISVIRSLVSTRRETLQETRYLDSRS